MPPIRSPDQTRFYRYAEKQITSYLLDSVLTCQDPARQITGQINYYNQQNHRDQDGGRFVHVE